MGSGTTKDISKAVAASFQSTHSVGSGTVSSAMSSETAPFQSTHSVGSGTAPAQGFSRRGGISIHPLRGEWDRERSRASAFYRYISIHPLRGEWDVKKRDIADKMAFQSTHSVGSGTKHVVSKVVAPEISIHPLRGEWDRGQFKPLCGLRYFNPPTPWGVGRLQACDV